MSDFSIHDIKHVEEFYDPDEVNNLLKSGWVLLSVGFNTEDKETYKVYILGNTELNPSNNSSDDSLAKIVKG